MAQNIQSVMAGLILFLTIGCSKETPKANEEPAGPPIAVDVETLVGDFAADPQAGNTKYQHKRVAVHGLIASIHPSGNDHIITLIGLNERPGPVKCIVPTEQVERIKETDEVVIEGKCDGYSKVDGTHTVSLSECRIKEIKTDKKSAK
ncbi:MAG: hypothetical protein KatS3mg105_1667 [Gemmatales bacterium]|nr:MAG: hypothetical protein KatS3mg105_1667 [Gemmatales bacterium]